METDMTTTQKVALIVGGTTGMGKESAKALLERGAVVRIVGRNPQRLEKVRAELGEFGSVETVQADLYDKGDVDALIASIDNDDRAYGYLVNAAGTFNPTPFLEHSE